VSNALAVREPQNQIALAASFRDKIDTIKQTVAKGASDAQLEMYLTLADKYQLDPFLKEIWFTPQLGIITGRDGYLKVAQRDSDFDGVVSCAVREGDHFSMNPMIPEVTHQFGAKRGPVIGAYAVAYHKKRRPAVCYADIAEYRKNGGVWGTYPSAMICKVAEVMALKRQFGISGLVTDVEVQQHEGSDDARQEVLSRKLDEARAAGIDVEKYGKAQTAPAVPPEVQAMWKRMDEGKYPTLDVFGQLKDQCQQVLGDEPGKAAYYSVLKANGVEKSDQFKSSKPAKKCARELWEAIQRAKEAQDTEDTAAHEQFIEEAND
jgi:phage recombination protein Bet